MIPTYRRSSGTVHPRRWKLLPLALLAILSIALAGGVFWSSTDQAYRAPIRDPAQPAPEASSKTVRASPALPFPLADQGRRIRFEHLTPDDGLSQSVVLDILQDDQGFLWFATQDGLNRYDGYGVKVFKNDPDTTNSLNSNFVNCIEKDASGVLWIGTNVGGLNRYDPTTGQFSHYMNIPGDRNSLSDNSITSVYVDREGMVWAGTTSSGLNRLDPHTGLFTRYQYNPHEPDSLGANAVTGILEDSGGWLWVGTIKGGLNRLDRRTGVFTHYVYNPADPGSLSSDSIQSLYEDRQGGLWVGTMDAGLNRFVPQTGKFIRYQNDPADPASLSHDWVLSMLEDRSGRFWIGTNGGGLNLLDRQTERFTRFRNNINDPDSLANDQIYSLLEDRSGIVWLGTFGSGVDKYDPLKYKFALVRSEPHNPQSLSGDIVWSIYQDPQDIFWIGTNGGGLNRYDPHTGQWRHYLADPSNPHSLSDNIVYYVYQDRTGTYWIGTNKGLNRFDPHSETFVSYDTPLVVWAMKEDHLGNFWVGTTSGLLLLDRQTGRYQLYANQPDDPTSLGGNWVLTIYEDAQGNLWLGTLTGGLNRFDRESGRFIRYLHNPADPASISSDSVIGIHQTQDGNLWLATAAGLDKFDSQTGKSIAYREKDGLPNDFVYGSLEDDQGNLWLSTNRGISRFNPRTLEFKNYDTTDGVQGNEFNQGAYLKTADGLMYFGGVKGLNIFDPAQVQDNPFIPPVVITNFQLSNQPAAMGATSPLTQPIEASREIQLAYTDGFFEFEYAALHFSSPQENQYAYRMEGLDQDWNFVGNRRFANYTNVPPGTYTFRVQGSNSDGVWNDQGAALKIVIPPPFWQTWWFRLLIGTAAIGGVYGAVALRIRSIEQQRRRLEIQVSERTHELRETMLAYERSKEAAEAASRAKSAFLANMSHEFRTPLNAILGFVQIMTRDERLRPDQRDNLEIIHRSSEHLLGLINDVLELSKIEAGRTSLKRRAFDLHRMLAGLEDMFTLRAEHKGLSLRLELAPDVPHYVHGDEGKLRQVLMNLLGNAVKFTRQGQVRLRVHPGPSPSTPPSTGQPVWIDFEVEDTGPGIGPDEVGELFQPFVQTRSGQQAQEGTGLGLPISQQYVHLMGGEIQVSSEVGRGSTFTFALPMEVASANDLENPPPTRQVIGLEPGQPVYRMLIVDDEEINRKLLRNMLAPIGFELREAANGQEALVEWKEWEPHLIWMDMRMRVMDGYEATRRIKATTRGQATIIIALTASAMEQDRAVILSDGCDDYIRKPFHEEELLEAAARHLGVRYVYKEVAPAGEAQPTASPTNGYRELTERIAAADPEWRTRLEQATLLGDLDAITRLTNAIAEQDPILAREIASLADKFEHDRILSLVRQARSAEIHATH